MEENKQPVNSLKEQSPSRKSSRRKPSQNLNTVEVKPSPPIEVSLEKINSNLKRIGDLISDSNGIKDYANTLLSEANQLEISEIIEDEIEEVIENERIQGHKKSIEAYNNLRETYFPKTK